MSATTGIGLKVIPRVPPRLARLLLGGRTITIDGNTLDTALQFFLAAEHASGIHTLAVNGDPLATRAQMRQAYLALGGPGVHVDVAELAVPGPAGAIPARHYRPPGEQPAPVLVFYHGGGCVFGDLDSYDALCRLIARDAGVHVLSIDYRLAPEHKAPAAVDDAVAAYRWAHEHAGELGALPGHVAVGGDSAGGHLSAVVCQQMRDAGGPPPVLQWLIYPVIDWDAETRSKTLFGEGFLLTKRDMEWFRDQYLEGCGIQRTDPRINPLAAEDLSGLPPALLVTAGFDPLRDEGEQYGAAMRAAGVTVDQRRMGSLTHGFVNANALGGGSARAIAEMISALRAHLSHG
jgi:acetyl esterase